MACRGLFRRCAILRRIWYSESKVAAERPASKRLLASYDVWQKKYDTLPNTASDLGETVRNSEYCLLHEAGSTLSINHGEQNNCEYTLMSHLCNANAQFLVSMHDGPVERFIENVSYT
jgi:hypothetical protein